MTRDMLDKTIARLQEIRDSLDETSPLTITVQWGHKDDAERIKAEVLRLKRGRGGDLGLV